MNNIRLGDVLIDFGYITQDQLQAALAYQKEHKNLRVGQALQELGYVNERQVLEALAQRLQLRLIDFAQINVDISAVEKVPRELAQKYDMLPIAINGRSLVIAANDPLNYYAIEDIRQLTSRRSCWQSWSPCAAASSIITPRSAPARPPARPTAATWPPPAARSSPWT